MKTWHYEYAVVIPILAGSAILSGNTLVAWISAFAVFASFGHASVADRMQEREAAKTVPHVDCHWKLNYYFFAKEIAWVLVFVLTKTWPALVGCGVFLAYPFWRKWWRKRHPLSGV